MKWVGEAAWPMMRLLGRRTSASVGYWESQLVSAPLRRKPKSPKTVASFDRKSFPRCTNANGTGMAGAALPSPAGRGRRLRSLSPWPPPRWWWHCRTPGPGCVVGRQRVGTFKPGLVGTRVFWELIFQALGAANLFLQLSKLPKRE